MGEARDELTMVIPIINSNPKAVEVMDGWPRAVQFELEGEGGIFFVVVEKGQAKLSDELTQREADIIVLGSGKEFARVVRRERDISHPVADGTIWLGKGLLSQMIIFDRVLAMSKRKG